MRNIPLSTGGGDGSTSDDGSISGDNWLIIISSAVVLPLILIGAGIVVIAVVIIYIHPLRKYGRSQNARSDKSNLELQSKGVH